MTYIASFRRSVIFKSNLMIHGGYSQLRRISNVDIAPILLSRHNKHIVTSSLHNCNYSLFRTFSSLPVQNTSKSKSHKRNPKKNVNKNKRRSMEINGQIIRDADNWQKLLAIYEQRGNDFDDINWSTFMNRIGRNRHREITSLKRDLRYRSVISSLTEIFSSNGLKHMPSTQVLGNIVHSLAKLNEPIPNILDFVDAESMWFINNAKNIQDISNAAWAFAKLSIPAPTFFKLIDENASKIVKNGKPQEISNIAWSCATLSIPAPSLFKLIDENAIFMINNGKPQEIANTAWSFAKLSIPAPNFIKLVDENASFLIKNGKPQEVSNIAWSCATLSIPAPSLFTLIEQNAAFIVISGKSQEVSNLAWSLATLSVSAPNFFKLVDDNASQIMKHATPQAISNIAWSFAVSSVSAPKFFQLVDENASHIVRNGNTQAISNIAWSCAVLSSHAPNLFKLIDENADKLTNSPQDLFGLAWSFAMLSTPAPLLLNLIEKNAPQLINCAKHEDISKIAWSCSTQSFAAPSLFSAIEENAPRLINEGTTQTITNIIWSYSALGYDGIRLLELVDNNSTQLFEKFNSHEIDIVSRAFAQLGFKGDKYFDNLQKYIHTFVDSLDTRNMCSILWSFAVLDLMDQKTTLNIIWEKIISTGPTEFNNEEIFQLAYFLLHAKANSISLEPLPVSLQRRVDDSNSNNMGSAAEDQYSELLQEIGFIHERQVSPCDDENYGNILLIDYACKDKMIAIEFDGPYHFLTNLKKQVSFETVRENGPSIAKRRLLKRLGWKVINITYLHDREINNKKDEEPRERKKQYLKQELEKVGVVL